MVYSNKLIFDKCDIGQIYNKIKDGVIINIIQWMLSPCGLVNGFIFNATNSLPNKALIITNFDSYNVTFSQSTGRWLALCEGEVICKIIFMTNNLTETLRSITLDLNSPRHIIAGEIFDVNIRINNISSRLINAVLTLLLPVELEFIDSNPKMYEKNGRRRYINLTLAGNTERNIRVTIKGITVGIVVLQVDLSLPDIQPAFNKRIKRGISIHPDSTTAKIAINQKTPGIYETIVPENVSKICYTIIGAGGAGGRSENGYAGGGGGSGKIVHGCRPVVGGESIKYTVGAAYYGGDGQFSAISINQQQIDSALGGRRGGDGDPINGAGKGGDGGYGGGGAGGDTPSTGGTGQLSGGQRGTNTRGGNGGGPGGLGLLAPLFGGGGGGSPSIEANGLMYRGGGSGGISGSAPGAGGGGSSATGSKVGLGSDGQVIIIFN